MTTFTDTRDITALAHAHYVWPLLHRADMAKEPPLVMTQGHSAHLVDVDGNDYLDLMSGLTRASMLGHDRADVIDAMHAQLRRLPYAGTAAQVADVTVTLAAKLAELTPGDLRAVAFSGSGSEANETAFKIAKAYQQAGDKPRAYKVIARYHAYHGATGAAGSASDLLDVHNPAEPGIPGFSHIPAPMSYRGEFSHQPVVSGAMYAEYLEREILHQGPDLVSAFIAEPVMQAHGVQLPPEDYFPRIREICDEYGVLLIADEVITGFGRTGKWFASEHFGVQPDIMTMAKGITAGYAPMGATVISSAVHERLARLADVHTFGGHAVSAAAASAAIDAYDREGLIDRSARLGARLLDRLASLTEYDIVGDVRGIGMWLAVEFTSDKKSKAPLDRWALSSIAMQARALKILVGRNGNSIEIAPPLTIDEDEALDGIDRFEQAVRAADMSHR
jgi:adenosylmethionine-8-amino-7-oxononanoate aminotransferase